MRGGALADNVYPGWWFGVHVQDISTGQEPSAVMLRERRVSSNRRRLSDRPLSWAMTVMPGAAVLDSTRTQLRLHFISKNSVGVLPVIVRNACEKAGTLA